MSVSPTSPKVTLRLLIHGRVQGVFFRESMRRKAQNLAITGWVRNLDDGTVEAVVHGEATDVDTIIQWAHHGPELADVERVEITPAEGTYSSFDVTG